MRNTRWIAVCAALALVIPLAQHASAAWDPVWRRSFAFSVESVAADRNGHVYVAGFAPRGEPLYFGQPWAMVLVKYGADGSKLWGRTWRSRADLYPNAAAFDVAVSRSGRDVYVVGADMNDSTEARRGLIWAYSQRGSLRWIRRTREVVSWSSVAVTSTGFVTGAWYPGGIAKWERDGTVRWMRAFEDPVGDHCDVVNDVAVGGGGAVFAVGSLDIRPTCNDSEGLVLLDDIVIQKRLASGALAWSRVLRDPDRDNDQAVAVGTAGKRIFVAADEGSRPWLARLTPGGRFVWERRFGLEGERVAGLAASVAAWGAVFVVTDRRSTPSSANGAAVLRAYTATGERLSARQVSLTQEEAPSAVTIGYDVDGADPGPALYVTARVFGERGDLWRLPT